MEDLHEIRIVHRGKWPTFVATTVYLDGQLLREVHSYAIELAPNPGYEVITLKLDAHTTIEYESEGTADEKAWRPK